jgi:sterol 3beta-glucosyltransferase
MTTSPEIRLVAMGTRGDVQPYIALAWGLQQAGHNVVVGTTSDFRGFVEDYGLKCITTDSDMKSVAQQGARGRVTIKGKTYHNAKWAFFQMLLDATLELSQGADILIYSSAMILTAPHVAEKLQIPAFPAMLQPYMTPTGDFPPVGVPPLPLGAAYNRLAYKAFEQFVWLFLKGSINKWRWETLGLPPYPESSPFAPLQRGHVPTLYGFSPSVLPKPAEWGDHIHVTGYWFLPPEPDWQPPTTLVDFITVGPPPVYIGFGSMASNDPAKTAELIQSAVKLAGVRAVVATGWDGMHTSNSDPDIYVLESVPHEWLFPQMAAIVHHGGAGTTGASLRAGVPTIVIPHKSDQPFWGHRVAEKGVGPQPIPRKKLTAEKLANALRQALNNTTMRQRAATLGEQIRAEDGITNAVKVIETFLPQPVKNRG